MSDARDDGRPVFIIIGRVSIAEGGPETEVHIMLKAADDDSAIREALNALYEDGYCEATFDQIGALVDAPDEEPHASAYQGALEGEVAIVAFDDLNSHDDDPAGGASDDDEEINPFDVLANWRKNEP